MADGLNQARALRMMELAGDFRTLQIHIQTQSGRYQPPDQASAALSGYALLRQASADVQQILAAKPDLDGASNPNNEEGTKSKLRKAILDGSTRRFRAQRCYLRIASAVRWIALRQQILQGQAPSQRHAAALNALDQRLREEVGAVTDSRCYQDLRQADVSKGLWISEDPSLQQILAFERQQM